MNEFEQRLSSLLERVDVQPPRTISAGDVRARARRQRQRLATSTLAAVALLVLAGLVPVLAFRAGPRPPARVGQATSQAGTAAITVEPAAALVSGRTVIVWVRGFPHGAKVWLSECASAAKVNPLGCGQQLAAQPFLATNRAGAASGKFTVSAYASARPYFGPLVKCAPTCVLVATSGGVAHPVLAYATISFWQARSPGAPTTPVTGNAIAVRSASFVSTSDGWALASAPCGAHDCSVVFRSVDGGRSWTKLAVLPSGETQLRFANSADGWAFLSSGNGLLATTDGGHRWSAVALPGQVVTLTVAGPEVFAVVANCPNQACRSAHLYQSQVGANRFSPVAAVAPTAPNDSPPFPALLRAHGAATYLVAGSPAQLWSDSTGTWQSRRMPPGCPSIGPYPLIAPFSATGLALVCPEEPGAGSQGKLVYESLDGGQSWLEVSGNPIGNAQPLSFGYAESLSAPTATDWFLADGRCCILATHDAGRHWQIDTPPNANAFNDGMSYVGFTTASQGFGLPFDVTNWIAITRDGGRSWSPVFIR